jgi:benzoyl-CoA reductase subunit C
MTSPAAITHYRTELRRLLSNLEELGGKKATDAALVSSIQVYNQNRALCETLYTIKRDTPWLLSTYEAYVLLRLATMIPVEEHTKIIQEILPMIAARDRKPRDYVRVMIEGSFCEQPPLELMQVIEEAGCCIVDDDLLLHTRWFHGDIMTNGDPLLGLAESYINQSCYSSVRHYGNKPRKEQFVRKIRAGNVDGVIFNAPKFCEPALLDYVVLKDELEKQGIAYLAFEYEEKMGVFESIRTQVETFVESVMFFS